ncbi:MAG: SBBP repeat-containing protein [Candidatus Eisenbacteria bacterium]
MFARNRFLFLLPVLLICFAPRVEAVSHIWSHGFGAAEHESGKCVAIDSLGNSVVTGHFRGPVDFGGGPITSAGFDDIFVAKFDPLGNHVWSHGYGGLGSYDRGNGVAVDLLGNVLVTGQFRNTVDFGGGPLTSAGGDDIFVAKFDPNGNHLWSKRFGNGQDQEGLSIGVDDSGNVLVAGYFFGTVDFGGLGFWSAGLDDIFVVKFDPDGNHIWSKSFGSAGSQSMDNIAIDGSGNLLTTGSFHVDVNFGGGVLNSAGDLDIFVAKFDASCNHIWSRSFGSEYEDEGKGVAVDDSGNVLLTGNFHDAVDFGGGPLTSGGGNDIFMAKYDPSGVHLWSQRFGDSYNQGGGEHRRRRFGEDRHHGRNVGLRGLRRWDAHECGRQRHLHGAVRSKRCPSVERCLRRFRPSGPLVRCRQRLFQYSCHGMVLG